MNIPLGGALPAETEHAPVGIVESLTGGPTAQAYVEEARRWLPDPPGPEAISPPISPRTSQGRVVLADDNADMRAYIRRLLEAADFEVEAVTDGHAALEASLSEPPHLLLADVMMPGLDGLELVRRLRSMPATAALPIILLSARAGDGARVEGFSAGADDYLVKPFNAQTLVARVAGAIRVAELRREVARRERQVASLEARVAAQQQAAEALRAARDEAEAARRTAELANQGKSRFLAAASHDLRQPTQGLFLFLDALAAGNLDPREQRAVENLGRALDALRFLLDSLLDVSRLDAGVVVPELRDVAVADVVNVLAMDYRQRASSRQLEFRTCSSSAFIRTDPALLGRILGNLLENAVRYTERGRILLGCRRHGDRLAIEVHDTGAGIPGSLVDEIFDEFVQVGNHERDRENGLGLGLAIVRRLSVLLDHPVAVHSEVGKGSMFSVSVPLAREANGGKSADGDQDYSASSGPGSSTAGRRRCNP